MEFFQIKSELGINPDVLFRIGNYPVTNTMMSGLLITFILILLCIVVLLTFKKSGKPGKFQVIIESLIESIINFTAQIAGNREVALKILPVTGAVFLYIGFSNIILVLLPFLSGLTIDGISVFRSHTGDFNTTVGIAAAVVIGSNLANIYSTNIFAYIGKFIKVSAIVKGAKEGPAGLFMGIIEFLLGFLDIISEFAKIISMSLRLFGNMFAGDILNTIIMGALAVVAPAILVIYSLFSGIIQAIVFGALTTSHFASAVDTEGDEIKS